MFCMLMFKRSIILSVALFSAVSNANSLSLEVENDVEENVHDSLVTDDSLAAALS